MEIRQIWMSRDTQAKSRYGLRTLGGILGIMALALLLVGGGTVLGFRMGWPAEGVSVFLCLGVTALAIALAIRLGQRSAGDATVFFLTEDDRLFVMDARWGAVYGRSLFSYAAASGKVQQRLRDIARSPELPFMTDEILRVEKIRENRSHFSLVCQVRRWNGRRIRRTCLLTKDMEDRETLLRQLERREGEGSFPELPENRNPLYILLSVLACGGFVVLCVLSHPAVAQLPQSVYFPSLGAAFAALCCIVWFAVRQHRGE